MILAYMRVSETIKLSIPDDVYIDMLDTLRILGQLDYNDLRRGGKIPLRIIEIVH